MKKSILITLAFSFIANADTIENSYKRLITQSIFTSNDISLQSGWYKDGDVDLTNSNFVGSYSFGEDSDKLRAFVIGGFGFSKIEQNDINIDGDTLDSVKFDSFYLKLGFGVDYHLISDLNLNIGASALWMDSYNVGYNTKQSSIQNIKLFDKGSSNTLYDTFVGLNYHPKFGEYQSYFKANIHYLNFDYDYDISSLDGFDMELKAGIHTLSFASIYNLPIWNEVYISSTLLDSDLADWVGFDYSLTAGDTIHWLIGPMIPLFDGKLKDLDIGFNLQTTTSSSDFKGWKASICCDLARF